MSTKAPKLATFETTPSKIMPGSKSDMLFTPSAKVAVLNSGRGSRPGLSSSLIMASPISARKVLLPVYAAAAEVARAPWLTKEHVIAEMRLQWWRDVFEEIEGGNPRRHEVVDALAEVLTAEGAKSLDTMALARRWDIYKEGFKDPESLLKHVRDIALGPLVANLDALINQAQLKWTLSHHLHCTTH